MGPIVEEATESVWVGEGPHWDVEEQALYFVSILDHTINRYVPATKKHTKAKLDAMPTFVIPVEGKQYHFVVGMDHSVVEIRWEGEEGGATVVRTVAEVETDNPLSRLNDAKVDPRGRLYSGTICYEHETNQFHMKKSSLYRFDPDGTVHKLESGIDMSNGLCWDVNEKAFYFTDSFEQAVRRYDYDIETGNISNPKMIFEYKDHGLTGIVDGMTIDADGNLWLANFDGSQMLHVDPRNSKLLRKVPIPALQVTSAAFGGPDLDTLFVTTGRMNQGVEQFPPCGCVFKVTGLGVKGLPAYKVKLN